MKARSWIGSVLVLAILMSAAAGQSPPPSPSAASPPAPQGKAAATVNGEVITLADVEAVLKQRPDLANQPNETQRRQLVEEVLGMLIDDHLLQQFLQKDGQPVPETAIAKWLAELETSLKTQGHTLQDFYRERNTTESQLRHNVANMLQWASYVNSHLSEAELKRYFEENRDFFDQISVRASHIVLRVPATGNPAERQAAGARLLALRQELAAGKLDFGEAAKKHSQCPSAAQGGDLGYFPRKFAVDENFARAAFALKIGDLSGVVQSEYGLHLIKVTDRKPGQPADFDKMKEEVREVAAEDMRLALLAQQRKVSKIEVLLEGMPALKTP